MARLKPGLRLLLIGLIGALVMGLVAVIGAGATIRRSFPERSKDLLISGLASDVRVFRDERGIPQIYAQNDLDLMRAQGFVHAQDRFFEMDLRRHVTAGRLAELVGDSPDAIASDRVIRTMGWRRVAEQELPLLNAESRKFLQAYAEGVNSYLKGRSPAQIAMEYTVLDLRLPHYRPAAWTPVDSLAWLKAMAWDLKANYDDELTRARLSATLPTKRIEQLYPTYQSTKNAPTLSAPELAADSKIMKSAGESPKPKATAIPQLGPALTDLGGKAAVVAAHQALSSVPELLGRGAGVGSNAWVVSGSRTANGKPLLANDPHLSPSLPGIWYQVGLHCVQKTPTCTFSVSGFSFSGLPGVIIGHNDKISWGLTNLGADVTDLFLERIVGGRVEYDGKYDDVVARSEVIKVRGGPEQKLIVRSTRHGPLLSDVLPEVRDGGRDVRSNRDQELTYDAALSWTALKPSRTADGIFILNRAKNWADFRKGAEQFSEPSQNMIYADVEGNIGYQAPGRIPVRKGFDGRWPVPGWSSAFSWTGLVPFDELPKALNPADGLIVSANQAVSPAAEPFLTEDWEPGYRAQRIQKQLQNERGITSGQMTALHQDTRNPSAEILVPVLLQIDLSAVPFSRDGQDLLRGWDFSQPADSAPAAYYNAVWRTILRLTFDDELGQDLSASGGERWVAVVNQLLSKPSDPWWDNKATPGVIEGRDEILRQSMIAARVELTRALGKDVSRWKWGSLHRLSLTHPILGGADAPGPLRKLVNRGPFNLAGGPGSVNATFWTAYQGYAVDEVPSMRMVIDLGNFDGSSWVNLTGVSGHTFDKHHLDQSAAWAAGRSYPWPFTLAAVERAAKDRQTLQAEVRSGPGAD